MILPKFEIKGTLFFYVDAHNSQLTLTAVFFPEMDLKLQDMNFPQWI
jgi:hypothetical protein